MISKYLYTLATSMFMYTKVLTPDGESISVALIPYSEAISILTKERPKEESIDIDFLKHRYYKLVTGSILFEKTLDKSYYLLFESQFDFDRFLQGSQYIATNIFLDSTNRLHAGFDLNPSTAYKYKQQSVSVDTTYKARDSNLPWILYMLPEGHCVWMFNRAKDVYQGYWFNSFEAFRYHYDHVFN